LTRTCRSCGSDVTGHPNKKYCDNCTPRGWIKKSEYTSWYEAWRRCTEPDHPSFKSYGARGISVCRRWKKFENFYADMGPKPTPKHMIDRIDSNGNYEPSNCRWATRKENMANRRVTVRITQDGITKTAKDWCGELNIPYFTAVDRIKRGYTVDEILHQGSLRALKSRERSRMDAPVEFNGTTKRLSEWCRELGISFERTYRRRRRGLSTEEILSPHGLWGKLSRRKWDKH
jgi:hypothetical protein